MSLRQNWRGTRKLNARRFGRSFRLGLTRLEERAVPATFTVTNTSDSGLGSLRDAITLANSTPGADTINFAITPAAATYTISLLTQLDEITEGVVIDASTQPGYAGTPIVELDGTFSGGNGFRINAADGVTIRGFAINRFANDGIQMYGGAKNVTINKNFIGTDLTGTSDFGMTGSGIAAFEVTGLGASTISITGNLISGNGGQGIYLGGGTTGAITIAGNTIGADITGKAKLTNGEKGVFVDSGVTSVVIGGATKAEGNLISGNSNAGVYLNNLKNGLVSNNIIGPDITGFAQLTGGAGNGFRGIWLNNSGASGNTISFNIIGDNKSDGIIGENGASKNVVRGNFIGFNEAAGIAFINAPANIIGGPSVLDRNYIGNNRDGILNIDNSFGATIQNNYIGTDTTGTAAFPNTQQGIEIGGSTRVNVIGNLIVASGQQAIEYRDGSDVGKIQGNIIGLDAAGNVLANGKGIDVRAGSEGVLIGGPNLADRNIISGNKGDAVTVRDTDSPAFQVFRWEVADGGNGNYYVLTPGSLWADAQAAAKAAGGWLASVSDAAENAFLVTIRNQAGSDTWIGYTDDPVFGGTEKGNTSNTPNAGDGWVWADGVTPGGLAGFNNWGGGEPNNFGAGENFAQLRGDGFWNDNGNISIRTIMEFTSPPDINKLSAAFNLTTVVTNNYIGTDATGTVAKGNTGNGVVISNYNGGSVGGVTVNANLISGNTGQGVRVNNVGGQTGLFQWTTGPGANNNFYVVGPSTSWRNAQAAAVSVGGNLVSIGNADEQAFVQSKVLPFLGGGSGWIGYTDDKAFGGQEFGNTSAASNKGQGWVWSDGTPVSFDTTTLTVTSYQNWNGGEPNNAGSGENFAEMVASGGWNDLPGSANRRSIFEFKSAPDLPALIAAIGLKTNVTNNLIGVNAAGTGKLGNGTGVGFEASSGVVFTGNVVSGNTGNGFDIVRSGANRIQGNFIGTDSTGLVAIGNGSAGVAVREGTANLVGSNLDGTNDAAEANLIRFNGGQGVTVSPAKLPTFQWTTGPNANNNYYVITPAGKWGDLQNIAKTAGGWLATIANADENAFVQNVRNIAGSDLWIGYTDDPTYSGLVDGIPNTPGTEFGNTGNTAFAGLGWVWVDGNLTPGGVSGFNAWGGGEPNNFTNINDPNYAAGENFAQMRGDGLWNDNGNINLRGVMEFTSLPNYVVLDSFFPGQPTRFNTVRGNSISGNAGIGIDLGDNGPTANDPGDPDVGPNDFMNFPTLTSASAGGSTTVNGSFNGLANNKIAIDFYANPTGSQAARYIGSTTVTTDGSGNATFSAGSLAATVNGEIVTATATDIGGNTSEISGGVTATSAATPSKVTGVVINNGAGQRSRVTSLKVNFDNPVTVATPSAAFSLVRVSDSASVTLNTVIDGSGTFATITFTGGAVDGANPVRSLADGRYTLTANASAFGGGGLDGDGNGTAGDNFVFNSTPFVNVSTPATGIFRLFGDANGNGQVGTDDFLAFRLAFLSSTDAFDNDGNGTVDAGDFLKFRLNFLATII